MELRDQVRGDKENPFHLSVGQVAVDQNGNIALIKKPDGVITLPRETAYMNEPPEDCLKRGAQEELGTQVEIERYLGSLITSFDREPEVTVEKTTLYFLTYAKESLEKSPAEDEIDDQVLWVSTDKAIELLSEQDNPEHKIIARMTAN